MVESELKSPIESLFDNFSLLPIAAASLAQVHEAYLKDTQIKVAVKVQFPQLKSQTSKDLWVISNCLKLIKYTT